MRDDKENIKNRVEAVGLNTIFNPPLPCSERPQGALSKGTTVQCSTTNEVLSNIKSTKPALWPRQAQK